MLTNCTCSTMLLTLVVVYCACRKTIKHAATLRAKPATIAYDCTDSAYDYSTHLPCKSSAGSRHSQCWDECGGKIVACMHTFTRRLSRMHCICRAPRCGDGQGCPRHQSTHVRKLALAFSYLLQLCHGLRLQHTPHVISGTSKARRTTYEHSNPAGPWCTP